jgi:hypothetical protein
VVFSAAFNDIAFITWRSVVFVHLYIDKHDYIIMEITVLYLTISRHQLSI